MKISQEEPPAMEGGRRFRRVIDRRTGEKLVVIRGVRGLRLANKEDKGMVLDLAKVLHRRDSLHEAQLNDNIWNVRQGGAEWEKEKWRGNATLSGQGGGSLSVGAIFHKRRARLEGLGSHAMADKRKILKSVWWATAFKGPRSQVGGYLDQGRSKSNGDSVMCKEGSICRSGDF